MDSFIPKSSYLAKCEYDEMAKAMTLTFKAGSTYKYVQVFPATWLSFKQSPDHSSYYANAIKGRLQGVPVIRKTIGKKLGTPLKTIKVRRPLDGNIFTAGTVNRAIKSAEGKQERNTKPSRRSQKH